MELEEPLGFLHALSCNAFFLQCFAYVPLRKTEVETWYSCFYTRAGIDHSWHWVSRRLVVGILPWEKKNIWLTSQFFIFKIILFS
jgi:hypothetical protein